MGWSTGSRFLTSAVQSVCSSSCVATSYPTPLVGALWRRIHQHKNASFPSPHLGLGRRLAQHLGQAPRARGMVRPGRRRRRCVCVCALFRLHAECWPGYVLTPPRTSVCDPYQVGTYHYKYSVLLRHLSDRNWLAFIHSVRHQRNLNGHLPSLPCDFRASKKRRRRKGKRGGRNQAWQLEGMNGALTSSDLYLFHSHP